METKLNITGMTCQHCVKAVETALKAVPGVESVKVSLPDRSATVTGSVDSPALIAAVTEEGYQAEVAQ